MRGYPYDYFREDNFKDRRNATESAGVAYDPESLLTGGEIEAGVAGCRRVWPDEETYRDAVAGKFTPEEIVRIAPRIRYRQGVEIARSPALVNPLDAS